jgi:acyl carrier protein phosphodiesterase
VVRVGEARSHERFRWLADGAVTLCSGLNFLGHLYLSGTDPLITVGNFMADAVKGRDLSRFDPKLEQGIRLHRAIDSYTDRHVLQRQGRERVHPHAGRYASVVMDMFYDHLLAKHWNEYREEPLPHFAQRMYGLLSAHAHLMPERTRNVLPYMVNRDWLTSYATLAGIGRALEGLSHRVPMGAPMRGAERVLETNMEQYLSEFRSFLPEIEAHVAPMQ